MNSESGTRSFFLPKQKSCSHMVTFITLQCTFTLRINDTAFGSKLYLHTQIIKLVTRPTFRTVGTSVD